MSECEHRQFRAHVAVGRLQREEGGPVTHYSADITVKCEECGTPFVWQGVAMGMSPYGPRVSPDGLELRVPLMPPGEETPQDLPGFEIRMKPVGANDDG